MLPVLTAAQTRALDRETEARGVPVAELMERAGLAVARAAVRLAGGRYGRRAVVMCGQGNNGGDGLVAARYLARWGVGAAAILVADEDRLGEPVASNLARARKAGVRVHPFSPARVTRELGRADVAVDALFGTGFHGAPEGEHARAIEILSSSDVPVVAVDIPSGVEGDTGAVRGPAVRAAVTVTFGGPKVGDVLHPGAALAGALEVVDIGFPRDLLVSDLVLVEAGDVRLPAREPDDHKRRSGVVLVLSGSRRMTGAPSLVARGAYRGGAGLVTVAVPQGILGIVQSRMAEATFLPLPEGSEGSLSAAASDAVLERLQGFDAVALGPGLSTDGETPETVRRVVRESPVPVVVDADAINAFAGRPADIADRAAEAVVTPHTGEFGRLFGMPVVEVVEDRVGLVRKAAAETRSVVVLKGSRSLIATPEGEVRVNPTGSSVLATGGTGDVLTGLVAALLARGLPPVEAATAGAWVHGVAGRLAGRRTGEGTTAGDVAEAIPSAAEETRV